MALTLNDFVQRSNDVQGASRLEIVGEGDGQRVSAKGTTFLARVFRNMTGDPTVNRATIDSFIQAIRAEHGDRIADMIKSTLSKARTDGKPLTAYLVRDAVNLVNRETANIRGHNQRVISDFKTDKGPNGLNAQIKDMAVRMGMPWLADSQAEVDGIINRARITAPPGQALNQAEVKLLMETKVHTLLTQAKTHHTTNQAELAKYLQNEQQIIDSILSNPLPNMLEIDDKKSPVTLNNAFSKEELQPLIDKAKAQVREMTQGSSLTTQAQLESALRGMLSFSKDSPPNPVLVAGVQNFLAELGVTLHDGSPKLAQIQAQAIIYGLHTEEGMEKGLQLALQLKTMLPQLAQTTDPGKLLGLLNDLGVSITKSGVTKENMQTLLPFAFKTAMALGDISPEQAKTIHTVLTGPLGKSLEIPMGKWGNTDSPTAVIIANVHNALTNAAREGANLRLNQVSFDAASLSSRVGHEVDSVPFTEIPNSVLSAMFLMGAPVGLQESGVNARGNMFALSRMDPDTAGFILKAFQGQVPHNFVFAMAYHYIQEVGKDNFTLEGFYQHVTGNPMPQQKGANFMGDLATASVEKIMERIITENPHLANAKTNVSDAVTMACSFMGLTPQQVINLYSRPRPVSITMADLNPAYMPSLGNKELLSFLYDKRREQVGEDLHRRFQRNTSIVMDFGNGTKLETGPGGNSLPETMKPTMHNGSLATNAMAQFVVGEVDKLCGPNKAQASAVYTLFTASALTFGRGTGSLITEGTGRSFSEHSDINVSLQKQPDGSILGTLTSAPGHFADLRVQYRIHPDGSNELVDFHMGFKPGFEVPQQPQQ